MKVKSEREVAQSCPTLSDPMDCSLLQKPLNAPHRSSTALGQCHLGLTHLFPMGHHTFALLRLFPGFPGGSDGKESVCNVGDLGLIPGLGRSPGEGKGYPLQFWPGEFHGLYNLWGCKELDMTERLSLSLHVMHYFPALFYLILVQLIELILQPTDGS